MIQPAGGGEPTLDGSFVTPEHPDGISLNDLNKPENSKEKEALVKALKEKFDAEKAAVDRAYKTLKSVRPDFRGSFYYSLIPVRVEIMAPASASVGTPVTLRAVARTELGPVEEGVYSWDFGNGVFAAGPNVTAVYDRPGNYKVTLTVRNDIGARGRAFREITVQGTAKVATAGGLRTVTFDTPPGQVRVNLPDDMMAGDTISGTVVAEPKGQNEAERTKNTGELTGLVIDIATPKQPEETSNANVKVTVSAANVPFTIKLPPTRSITGVSTSGSSGLGITLTNTTGSFTTGGTTTVPIEMVSLSLQSVAPLRVPQLPSIGQQGRPIEIYGPFDGDSSNTKLMYGPAGSSIQDFEKNTENVTGGFGLLPPLAESPRKCVFKSPNNVTGPIEIKLKEGNQETKGTYRNVGVNLTAPKTNLLKGEHTTLTVQVSGLQGIKQPVPLTLDSTDSTAVITKEGGPYELLMIQPSQVGADGRYTTTRGITGIQAGGWNATATVVTHRFDFCLQDDSSPQTVIQWNSFTGDYIFTPSGGTNLSGQGTVTRKGCTITLTDSPPDRRVESNIDSCTKTGSASVQTSPPNSPKVKFTITDRNTANNTCSCGPGCK